MRVLNFILKIQIDFSLSCLDNLQVLHNSRYNFYFDCTTRSNCTAAALPPRRLRRQGGQDPLQRCPQGLVRRQQDVSPSAITTSAGAT